MGDVRRLGLIPRDAKWHQPLEYLLCDRCQGNGEIVTDWDRYLEPHAGDIGDEAVAECPDCDGYGLVERG